MTVIVPRIYEHIDHDYATMESSEPELSNDTSISVLIGKEYVIPYQNPSRHELILLTTEASLMIVIYLSTLGFTIYNVRAYLIRQKRYKNWLITVFYILSFLVLCFRVCYYSQLICYYWEI